MIKAILFVASNIINILIIINSKNSTADTDLQLYAISSAIVSILFTHLYGNERQEKKINIINFNILALTIYSVFFYDDTRILWITYASTTIASEYALSQKLKSNEENVGRIFGVGILGLFVIDVENEAVMMAKIIINALIIIYSLKNQTYKKLSIKKSLKFIVLVYLAYTGAQITYTLMYNSTELKMWFVANQIGIGLYLKYIDYKTRGYEAKVEINKLVVAFVLSIGLIPLIMSNAYAGILVYIASIILLTKAELLTKIERN
jgi:hypothetical protein